MMNGPAAGVGTVAKWGARGAIRFALLWSRAAGVAVRFA